MGFHTTGDLSYGKTRTFRHLCPSACTQQFQASGRQHTSTALLVLVSVLFLSWYRPIYFFLNMDWRWRFHLSFRQKWMAHRIQRTHLWPGLLFILQRYFPQTRTSHCPLAIDHVPLWWAGLEYVPPVCQGYYFMGRTYGRSHSRHAVCCRFHKVRATTSRPLRRRSGRGREQS